MKYLLIKKDYDMVTYLLQKGANINYQNKRGETAMHLALLGRNIDAI
jgi:ankyrin repeat protein